MLLEKIPKGWHYNSNNAYKARLNPERVPLLPYNITISPFQGSKIRFANKATIIASLRDSSFAPSKFRT
jgi:hypothetical protein